MLEIAGLKKKFAHAGGATSVLSGVDLTIRKGELFVLLGPSGCGKTTTLRAIAGLVRPDKGTIRIGGQTVFSAAPAQFIPPERRPIAMVFQSYAIWPHMSVWENIAFPIREGVRRIPAAEVEGRVHEVLDLLHLGHMKDRPVTTLSGGQQQRVALARALALRPKVLLMDEPLSNLDSQLQTELRRQIRKLVDRLGLTVVYVTHNQAEAMELGDRIAVLDDGQLSQVGTPRDIYCQPANGFIARFIGEMNFIPGSIIGRNDSSWILRTTAGTVHANNTGSSDLAQDHDYLIGVRPADVGIESHKGEPLPNVFCGKVAAKGFLGESNTYLVEIGDLKITVRAHHRVEFDAGALVDVRLPPESCRLFHREHARDLTTRPA